MAYPGSVAPTPVGDAKGLLSNVAEFVRDVECFVDAFPLLPLSQATTPSNWPCSPSIFAFSWLNFAARDNVDRVITAAGVAHLQLVKGLVI